MLSNPNLLKITAIYIRVSTDEQADSGFSIEGQYDTLKNYCDATGRTFFKAYIDRGISGKSTENRYELQQMLRDAQAGLFTEVLVWKISRLARKTKDLLDIVDQLNKHNVTFRSYSESFETETPMGKFTLSMMGGVAELERNTIIENVKMGLKQRAAIGKHNAKPPLGYKVMTLGTGTAKRKETKITVVEEEAVLVRRIFEKFSSGHGYRSIANGLNHDGYVTKTGISFSTCAVKDIIDNPFYVGKVRYNRYENWSEKRRKGRSQRVILEKGVHDPIIAEDLWEKVQALRQKRSTLSVKRFDVKFLLTGLIRCPQCGGAMTASCTKNKLKDGSTLVRTYYSCANFRSKGSSVCSANSVRKEDSEKHVTDRLKEVLSKPHVLKAIVRGINERKTGRIKPLQKELEAVSSMLLKLKEKKLRYLELFELDQVEREMFASRIKELDTEADKLHAKKSELEFELNDDHSQTVSYEQVRSLIGRFEHLLRDSTFEQRKTLLHLIIQTITVDDKRQIDKIEMVFDETTEQHFLSLAPSAKSQAEGAFLFDRKAPKLTHKLIIYI